MSTVVLFLVHFIYIPAVLSWKLKLLPCPGDCGKGNCNLELGVCECPLGWGGPACEEAVLGACRYFTMVMRNKFTVAPCGVWQTYLMELSAWHSFSLPSISRRIGAATAPLLSRGTGRDGPRAANAGGSSQSRSWLSRLKTLSIIHWGAAAQHSPLPSPLSSNARFAWDWAVPGKTSFPVSDPNAIHLDIR